MNEAVCSSEDVSLSGPCLQGASLALWLLHDRLGIIIFHGKLLHLVKNSGFPRERKVRETMVCSARFRGNLWDLQGVNFHLVIGTCA